MMLQQVRAPARIYGDGAIENKVYRIPWWYLFHDLKSVSFSVPSDDSLFKKWAFHSSSMSDTERIFYEDRAINFDLRNNCLLVLISDEFANKLAAYAQFKGHARYILFKNDRLNYLLIPNFQIIHFINHVSFFKVSKIDKKFRDILNKFNKLAYNGSYNLSTIFVTLKFKWLFIEFLLNQDCRERFRQMVNMTRMDFGADLPGAEPPIIGRRILNADPDFTDLVGPRYHRVSVPAAPDITYYKLLHSKYCLVSSITRSAAMPLYNMLKDNDYDANELNSCLRGMTQCAYPSEICKIICDAPTSNVWFADDILCHAIGEVCGALMPAVVIAMLMEYSDMDETVITVQNEEGKDIVLFGL